MKILSVDDNAENRYLIEAVGRAHGFEVVSACNGLEALENLDGQPVDLIVSDVLMPEMDGFQLCHEVKSRERTRRIPFIFYTATYTASQDAELGLSLGASRYVVKPVDPDEFINIIGEVISEAQKGELAVPKAERMGAADYLNAYNARLVQKLDRKIEQLDTARNELQTLLAHFRALVTASSDVLYRMSPNWSELHDGDVIADTETPGRTLHIHPDDRSQVMAVINEAIRTKSIFELEHRVRRADGSVGWTFSRAVPLKNANGEIVEWFGAASDITERKRAEEALAVSESRLRALLESASQGIVAVDVNGRIALVNAKTEEMFGYARDELLDQPLEVLLPERYRTAHVGHLEHYFAHPHTRVMGLGLDLHGRSKNGNEFPVEVTLSYTGHGGSRMAMALITDTTERKKAEDRLWQAQKLESIGLLAGGVAHDFNNLLVGVIGNASLAQEMLPRGGEVVKLLQRVIETGEQLAHLTRQMLAYSGKGQFVVEPLNLSELIPEISGFVQPSIPKKVTLQFELEPHLPLIEADRGQIQQIFMNLVLNAAEAIGNNPGLISVKTGVQVVDEAYIRRHPEAAELHQGKYVCLEVGDTGCGMDAATKGKSFDPFFSTKFTGRGLGLAAVSGIVRGHKGAIIVKSAPAKGSCFTVLFPAAEDPIAVPPAVTDQANYLGSGTVLVVDDEELVRDVAKNTLERLGYHVLLADSGRAALDVFKRYPGKLTVLVLDLSMPGMGGEEALLLLQKIRSNVKVVVTSGYSEAEVMRLFAGQHVSGFLQKPFTSTQLAEAVKMALAGG